MNDGTRIVIVLLLVLGNAFFVIAEYALVTARRGRVEERAEKGSRGARVALRLMEHPVRFISTVQVGITVLGILLGAVGEPMTRDIFTPALSHTVAFILGLALITFLSVVLGELVPKAIALEKADLIASFVAVPIDWIQRLVYPLTWLLQHTASLILKPLGIKSSPTGVLVHTEEELRSMLAQAEETGVIEEAEEEMLYKVFDFADTEVREVMVAKPEVVAISVDLAAPDVLAAVIDSPYTRYPAYRGSLDTVLGVLHVRDLFSALYADGIENVKVENLLRPVHVVPETKDLAPLLGDFRRTKQHMAIVVDEYGSTVGIVTLEDLVEEIVGEISDEYDLPDEAVERVDEQTIRIEGTYPIDDFNEEFDQRLPVEDFHTLGGFVFGELGRAPEEGDEVARGGLRFRVLGVDGARIGRLEIEFVEPPEQPEHEAEVEAEQL